MTNDVFIANFGRGNYEWPECRQSSTIATMNDEYAHQYWVANDRDGYIQHCMRHIRTAADLPPTKAVASRWFRLMTIVSETQGDTWIHREKNELWWTVSRSEPATITLKPDPDPLEGSQNVYVCHKPCQTWSNQSKAGAPLSWPSLHPKAKEFLFTEGSIQRLTADNARYAIALIEGGDLSVWHERKEWEERSRKAGRGAVTEFNPKQLTIFRMARDAMRTAEGACGEEVISTTKVKEFRFKDQHELEELLETLFQAQEGLCAITGLQLQFDKSETDREMLCSLDRIDSHGHYEVGNLQIVCRFINRWKSDQDDADFRRLLNVVRNIDGVAENENQSDVIF